MLLQVTIVIIYVAFVTIESVALIARSAGHWSNAHPLGMSLHNAILAANRFLGFFIGPLLGYLIDNGKDRHLIFEIGIISSLVASFGLIWSLIYWGSIGSFFSGFIESVKINGFTRQAIARAVFFGNKTTPLDRSALNIHLLVASVVITGFILPVPFVINLLAINNPEYKSSILQMTGLISGLGSIILNFYANPHLAVLEQRNVVGIAYYSLHVGKIIGLMVISPLLIGVAFFA